MDIIDCTWIQFREAVTKDIQHEKRFIYRGHSDSTWKLKTTLHRTGKCTTVEDIVGYMDNVIPRVHEAIAAWEGRSRNLANPFELAQFIAYLQHNGFPTPFLDCTYSPYIAAYFAFEGVNHFKPSADFISIYCFDKDAWLKQYAQSYDYRDKNMHVSVIEPSVVGNPKQFLQQSTYLYTNLEDIESHIQVCQKGDDPFLRKYRISCKERYQALNELRLMNITAMHLSPSVESVCKKAAIDIALLFPMGETPADMEAKPIENMKKLTLPMPRPSNPKATD